MKETLQIGDHILVNKFIYGVKLPFVQLTVVPITDPERGDIIVFKYPEDPKKDFIKRVVAVGGDEVEIRNKQVYVNRVPVDDDYAHFTDPHILPSHFSPRDNLDPVTVPENSLFVMGDNRDNSHDSRFWGFVNLKDVKGKAFIIYWSWDKSKFGVRWNRLARLIN
jgi:signal peptidase I